MKSFLIGVIDLDYGSCCERKIKKFNSRSEAVEWCNSMSGQSYSYVVSSEL